MKTFKKTLAWIGLFSMLAMNVAMAGQIGTGTITGGTSTGIELTWTTATWVLTPVVVTASVDPVLNMTVSTGGLALGTLDTVGKSANLAMELGTNATNWLFVIASSANGWLTSNTASGIINSELTDGVKESYTFASSKTQDSTVSDFASSALSATEITTWAKTKTVYTTNRPEITSGLDDVTFTVSAKSAEQTAAASDYSDTITFTVVGSF